MSGASEQARGLERIWAGGMGTVYARTHAGDGACRAELWREVDAQCGWPARILEVGCNSGQNLRHWAALPRPDEGPRHIVGVDINAAACDQARRLPGVRAVHHASAYALPLDADTFDLAFCAGVLIHLPPDDAATALQELARVVRRGGHVVLLEQETPQAPTAADETPEHAAPTRPQWWYGLREGLWRHSLAALAAAVPSLRLTFSARAPSCGGPDCACADGGTLTLAILRKHGEAAS